MTPDPDERAMTETTHCEWCGAEYPADAQGTRYRHRVLAIAEEGAEPAALREDLRGRADDARVDVLVVTPATAVLEATVGALAADGIHAHGELGDRDPLRALDHGVRIFHPDEVVVLTRSGGRSRWLQDGLVDAARGVHHLPIRHLAAAGGPTGD